MKLPYFKLFILILVVSQCVESNPKKRTKKFKSLHQVQNYLPEKLTSNDNDIKNRLESMTFKKEIINTSSLFIRKEEMLKGKEEEKFYKFKKYIENNVENAVRSIYGGKLSGYGYFKTDGGDNNDESFIYYLQKTTNEHLEIAFINYIIDNFGDSVTIVINLPISPCFICLSKILNILNEHPNLKLVYMYVYYYRPFGGETLIEKKEEILPQLSHTIYSACFPLFKIGRGKALENCLDKKNKEILYNAPSRITFYQYDKIYAQYELIPIA